MTTVSAIDEFHQLIFKGRVDNLLYAHFNHTPKSWRQFRKLANLNPAWSNYVSQAGFPADTSTDRTQGRALGVWALVVDDVGTKANRGQVEMALGPPTYEVITSPGNSHWWYRLSKPVPVKQWKGFFRAALPGVAVDENTLDGTHVFRPPCGVNTKPGANGFKPCRGQVNPDVEIDVDKILPFVAPDPGPGPSKASKGSNDGRIKNIRRIVALLPNNTDHGEWMARMHQIWVLSKDKEEGHEAFREFSARWVPSKKSSCSVEYDPDDKWESIREDDITTAGQVLLDDACRANPDEYTRIINEEADGAFDDKKDHAKALKDHVDKLAGKIEFVEDTQRAARAVLTALDGTVKRLGVGDWRQFDERTGRWMAYRDDHMLRIVEEAAFQRRQVRALSKGMAKKIGTVKYLRGVSTLAAINIGVSGSMGDFDVDPLLLGVPSGVIDLRAGASRVIRPGRVGEMVSKATAVDPAGLGGSGIRWKKFLHEFTQGWTDLEDWLQVYAGYCLTGLTQHHVMPFFYGDGRNGKSVYLNTLRRVWGEYGCAIDKRLLFEKQGTPHGAFVAVLAGRRFGVLTDVKQDAVWDEEEVKRLTGGDEVSANLMHQNPFNFTPVMKFAVGGNYQPGAKTMDAGLRARMKLIPLNSQPPVRDATLPFALTVEYAEILRWALDGLDMYWANRGTAGEAGALAVSSHVEGATDAYNDVLDPFGRWKKACLVKDKGNVPMTEVYKSWDNFRNNEQLFGQKPSTIATLSRALNATGLKTDQIGDVSHLLGHKVKGVANVSIF